MVEYPSTLTRKRKNQKSYQLSSSGGDSWEAMAAGSIQASAGQILQELGAAKQDQSALQWEGFETWQHGIVFRRRANCSVSSRGVGLMAHLVKLVMMNAGQVSRFPPVTELLNKESLISDVYIHTHRHLPAYSLW